MNNHLIYNWWKKKTKLSSVWWRLFDSVRLCSVHWLAFMKLIQRKKNFHFDSLVHDIIFSFKFFLPLSLSLFLFPSLFVYVLFILMFVCCCWLPNVHWWFFGNTATTTTITTTLLLLFPMLMLIIGDGKHQF